MRQQYIIEAGGKTRQVENAIGSTVGFISWKRLFAEAFPAAGEIRQGEYVPSFQVSDDGITYTIVETSSDAAA